MVWFALALISTTIATLAGREAVRVARLSEGLGSGPGLLVACWLAAAFGSGMAAWAGAWGGDRLPTEAIPLIASCVLLLAAVALALLRPGRAPTEPTRSFGAIASVLAISQLAAPSSLIAMALAMMAERSEYVAFGGLLGAGAVLDAARRRRANWETEMPVAFLRRIAVVALLCAGLALALFGPH
ncbi:MAG TPA: hypothetical protein VNR60_03470 [Croceibacterium sp.]|nr:hypothetical protein [Croceibacterium sp.]